MKNISSKKSALLANLTPGKKKCIIAVCALALAVVLLLVIINPANSPESVFNRYLGCLHAQNEQDFQSISYEANFSNQYSAEDIVNGYKARFSSVDPANSAKVDLLKDTKLHITKAETPTQTEIASRRANLAERCRNTNRITDIRNITFEIKRGEEKTYGTAELICVTGKWYISDVTGI